MVPECREGSFSSRVRVHLGLLARGGCQNHSCSLSLVSLFPERETPSMSDRRMANAKSSLSLISAETTIQRHTSTAAWWRLTARANAKFVSHLDNSHRASHQLLSTARLQLRAASSQAHQPAASSNLPCAEAQGGVRYPASLPSRAHAHGNHFITRLVTAWRMSDTEFRATVHDPIV